MILDFRIIDFCKLMVANMKLENVESFNVNTISSKLVPFYNDQKYSILFSDMHIGDLGEISDVKKILFDMLDSGYHYFYQYTNTPNIYNIALKENEAQKFANMYKREYQILMSDLIKNYKITKEENINIKKKTIV